MLLLDQSHRLGTWLATYLAHSTLLLLAAWAGSRILRAPAQRELLWRIGLLGGLLSASLTASLQPWLAGLGFTLPVLSLALPAASMVDGPAGGPAVIVASVLADSATVGSPPSPSTPWAPGSSQGVGWPTLLFAVWSIGAVVGLLRLELARRRFSRGLARRPMGADEVPVSLASLLRRSGQRSVRLSESPFLASPIALGWNEICVPAGLWRTLDPAGRRCLLAHELAHVVRRDPLWFLAVQMLERVFFLQPLNRLARRRLAAEAELLSDDWAAARTGEPLRLAVCLSEVAGRMDPSEQPLPVPGMASGPSSLVLRVQRLLSERERPPSRAARLTLGAGGALALGLLACAGPGLQRASTAGVTSTASITATLTGREDPFAVVCIAPDGHATLSQGSRVLGWDALDTREGLASLAQRLALIAEAMPRSRTDGVEWPRGRLQIQAHAGTSYAFVQRVMQCCSHPQVGIWNLEVVGIEPMGRIFPIPMPHALASIPEEIVEPEEGEPEEGDAEEGDAEEGDAEEGETPPRPEQGRARLELRIDATGEGEHHAATYRLTSNRWVLEDGHVGPSVALSSGVALPYRTDELGAFSLLLQELHTASPEQRVTIDPRPGTFYQDVSGILEAVIEAGFTDIVFTGVRE